MNNLNPARITIGVMIISGLLFFKPLAYFTGVMMIFAGITGVCLLERFYAKLFGIKSSCSVTPAAGGGKGKKMGIIISTDDAETCWNAFRFANFSLDKKDAVNIFLIGKGVEYQNLSNDNFNIIEQAEKFIKTEGRIYACGTCLKQRNNSGSNLCPISTMNDMHSIVSESDKLLTF